MRRAATACRCTALAALLVSALAPPLPARAQEEQRFLFIVPSGYEDDFNAFLGLYVEDLNAAFDFFTLLYNVTPPLPIYIRVYADRAELIKQNVLAPPLAEDGYHTHLGAREISLIAPLPPGFLRSRRSVDVMRHEMNGVFLSTLSASNLPGGLELGIDQYVTLPEPQMKEAVEQVRRAHEEQVLLTWRALFDGTAVYTDHEVAYPQALAVASYLIDRFGFPSMIEVARAMGRGQSLAGAFTEVYGQPMDRLEVEWQAYLPGYLESRWQFNALYHYDLSSFQGALDSGAYGQVARGLEAVIPFLALTGQVEAHAQAERMLQRAQAGMGAGELVLGARDALQSGDYQRTLELVALAREAYAALGNNAREAELAAYEARALETLALRDKLSEARRLVEAGQAAAAEAQLLDLAPRFLALGDSPSSNAAMDLLQRIHADRLADAARRSADARRSIVVLIIVALAIVIHQSGLSIMRLWRKREEAIL